MHRMSREGGKGWERDRETDRQAGRKAERQAGRKSDRQRHR